jgi:FtsZ-interacting cell division protein ZipA
MMALASLYLVIAVGVVVAIVVVPGLQTWRMNRKAASERRKATFNREQTAQCTPHKSPSVNVEQAKVCSTEDCNVAEQDTSAAVELEYHQPNTPH